ncbi:MAG: nitroreductase family protein [Pseudomonadota bacterium]
MVGKIGVSIDTEKCSGCGLCLRVCPDRTLSLENGKAVVSGIRCIACGHCGAVCPDQAVSVNGIDRLLGFTTFQEDISWLPWGESNVVELVRLLRSRRSCRNYLARPVTRDILGDLVKIGCTAPSGTNSQGWTFTVLEKRCDVEALGNLVARFYKHLNRKAENPLLRFLSRIFMGDVLGNYYRRYYQTIRDGLQLWDDERKDLLFHGAVSVIIVGSRQGGSCPVEDALLATENILLGAHAMGLGTCLIGFVVEAMKRDRSIQNSLGIPGNEEIHAVIALGYPAEKYREVAGRKEAVCRFATCKR